MAQSCMALDPLVQLTGRTAAEGTDVVFYWPASSALVRFRGSRLSCELTPNVVWGSNCLGVVVDGRLSRMPVNREQNGRRIVLTLAENLEPEQEHTALLFKQLDCSYSYALHSFSCDGSFLPPPERPALRLEFYGDSVTSGAVVEATDYVGVADPPSHDAIYDNAWWSYAWQCARILGAELHTVSQGGIAVLNDTGYFHYPDGIGMVDSWDRLCYFPEAGAYTKWDFHRFIPHAVVFALGQNDHHNAKTDANDLLCEDEYRVKWQQAYKEIAAGVMTHYPKGTPLVFITTLIRHERAWDDAIEELCQQLCTEGWNAHHLLFRRNGDGTNGHPRIPEQREMAEELAAFLKKLLPVRA